jgi:hypothetical protein
VSSRRWLDTRDVLSPLRPLRRATVGGGRPRQGGLPLPLGVGTNGPLRRRPTRGYLRGASTAGDVTSSGFGGCSLDDYYAGVEGARRLIAEIDMSLRQTVESLEDAESLVCSIELRLSDGEVIPLRRTYRRGDVDEEAAVAQT